MEKVVAEITAVEADICDVETQLANKSLYQKIELI